MCFLGLMGLAAWQWGCASRAPAPAPIAEQTAPRPVLLDSAAAQALVHTASRVSPVDGMQLVQVPAGEFIMGQEGDDRSSPQHRVYLDEYWIDQTEVTNAMYAACVRAGACEFKVRDSATALHFNDPAYANHPVVYISWQDAAGYCEWAGRRLPTEAEWEKAGRGDDGRLFPWGAALPGPGLLNFDQLYGDTTPVGAFPAGASPYGVLDMAGNVREWVADWFKIAYYRFSPAANPSGPPSGEKRVLRGGAFDDPGHAVRVTTRFAHDPVSPGLNRGFRCASIP